MSPHKCCVAPCALGADLLHLLFLGHGVVLALGRWKADSKNPSSKNQNSWKLPCWTKLFGAKETTPHLTQSINKPRASRARGSRIFKGETYGDDADLESTKPFPWHFRIKVQEQILPQENPNCYQRKAGDFSWRRGWELASRSFVLQIPQQGQVCLTLHWPWINKMGTDPFGEWSWGWKVTYG